MLEILTRPHAVEYHVGRYFEQNDAKGQHLLANVELVLRHANVLHEVVRNGVGLHETVSNSPGR